MSDKPDKGGKIKVFLAIPLSETLAMEASRFRELNREATAVKWVPDANFHITQYFFGRVSIPDAEHLVSLISQALLRFRRYSLEPVGFSLEGKPRKPSMVWLKFHQHDVFKKIYEAVHRETHSLTGRDITFRDPVPHITLARLKRSASQQEFTMPPLSDILAPETVSEMELWRSDTVAGRVVYRRLAAFSLGG